MVEESDEVVDGRIRESEIAISWLEAARRKAAKSGRESRKFMAFFGSDKKNEKLTTREGERQRQTTRGSGVVEMINGGQDRKTLLRGQKFSNCSIGLFVYL